MTMPHFNLPRPGDAASAALQEITGGENSVRTSLHLARLAEDSLEVVIEAEDPDPLALIATPPTGRTDQFLYEEDCVQVAVALPGEARPSGLCLANPMGSRRDVGAAVDWQLTAKRNGTGWRVALRIPLSPDAATLGLGVLRYFRGVHHEVHGIGHPHPIDVADLAVVVLQATSDPAAAAERHVAQAREAQAAEVRDAVAACRDRMANARGAGNATVSVATARELARARAERPVVPQLDFLCWNESHFQNALINL